MIDDFIQEVAEIEKTFQLWQATAEIFSADFLTIPKLTVWEDISESTFSAPLLLAAEENFGLPGGAAGGSMNMEASNADLPGQGIVNLWNMAQPFTVDHDLSMDFTAPALSSISEQLSDKRWEQMIYTNGSAQQVHIHKEAPQIAIEFSGAIHQDVDLNTLMRAMKSKLQEELASETALTYRY
ncbi:MAG: hypothetical protein U0M15_04360 [Bacillota bacterium]|nr:hypothetical protein [Bacillota bacterium]